MKRTIIGQLRLARSSYLLSAAVVLIGGILGTVIFELIMRLEEVHSDDPTTFEMAFVCGMLCYVINFFVSSISAMGQNFNNTIGMGRTRKNFFIGNTLSCLINSFASAVALFIIYLTEQWRLHTWWNAYPCETNFSRFFTPGVFCFAIILLAILQEFIGFAILRFGKKAFWVLWAIWMLGCLGIPRIIDGVQDGKNSPLASFGRFLIDAASKVPTALWFVIGGGIGLVLFLISYVGFKHQQVTA